jgi:hypothetical protein
MPLAEIPTYLSTDTRSLIDAAWKMRGRRLTVIALTMLIEHG